MGQVEKSIIRSGLKYKPTLVTKQKASEIFESLLCNPDGDIAIVAPNYEKKMLKAGIEKVKELEDGITQLVQKYEVKNEVR